MLPTCAVTQPEMRVRSTLSPYLHRGPAVVQFETIPVHRGVGAWARASRIALACMQDRRCQYQQMRQYFSIRIRGRQRAGCGRDGSVALAARKLAPERITGRGRQPPPCLPTLSDMPKRIHCTNHIVRCAVHSSVLAPGLEAYEFCSPMIAWYQRHLQA